MNRSIKLIVIAVILTLPACSAVWSAGSGEVWLANSLALRVRCAAGGYSIDQRVNALQLRANDLLKVGDNIPPITVRKSGKDANIYTGGALFVTVTPADAQANGTTSERLANIWAERLRNLLPKATMFKPGVGSPVHTDAPSTQ